MKTTALAARFAVMLAFCAAPPVVAETPAEFYRGKQLRIIVSSSAGSSYDIYARSFAPHFSTEIPGQPLAIVQNMQGATGVRATNYLFNVAPKDGGTIGVLLREIPFQPLYGEAPERLQYETLKFNWIGSLNNETSICATWHSSSTKTFADATNIETMIGSNSVTDTSATTLNKLLNTKFRVISGYNGASIELAIERREVDGRCGWSWSTLKSRKPEWLRDKKLNILVQVGLEPNEELKGVPFVMDLAKNDRDRRALRLIFAPLGLGRPFAAPPDVPADRVKALRDAFDRAAANPQVAIELEKQSYDVTLVTGERMTELLAELMNSPPDVIEAAVAAVHK